jgi:hypothetical protein
MAHVLAKLTGVKLADVKHQLETDASSHAEQGMHGSIFGSTRITPMRFYFYFE